MAETVKRIPVYPEHERQYRIDAFMAQMYLNKIYFWPEGIRRGDPYLRVRAASEIVLFGGRLVLAYNRILFPCQRRLIEYVAAAPQKPEGVCEVAYKFLAEQTPAAMEEFCNLIESFADWNVRTDLGNNYERDVEMNWFTRKIGVAEW